MAELTAKRSLFSSIRLSQLGLAAALVLLAVLLTIKGGINAGPDRPNLFLNTGNLVDGIAGPMSYFAIMAVGMTIVIITGGIDISVGAVMALSALLTAWALQHLPRDATALQTLPIAIGLPLLIGLACGLVNGLLVVSLRLHSFIVTLGTMSVFRGLANVLPPNKTMPSGGRPLPDVFTTNLMRLEFGDVQFMPMLVMLLVVAVGFVYLKFTVMGVQTYAIGGNEEAARFSGLPVNWIRVRSHAICGLLAGLAGMVSLGRFGTASATTGLGYELTVVAAAVVGGASLAGGRGGAMGALLGALLIAMIENGIIIARLEQEYRLVIIGAAIVVAASFDRIGVVIKR